MNELVWKDSEIGRFQQLKGIIKKFTGFLSRRYIWSGLLAGFLWAFSAPFLLSVFFSFFENLPEKAIWILFFPLELSDWLTQWILDLGFVDPVSWIFILLIVSLFVGMFLGVVFTYSVHRIRVWRRGRNVSRTVPSE